MCTEDKIDVENIVDKLQNCGQKTIKMVRYCVQRTRRNAMTIADFLRMREFAGIELIAGKNGMDRELVNVTVVDTPDGARWVKEGEFVVTTAYMLQDAESELPKLLELLASRNAAGLGIKENRYLVEIPLSARKRAEELGLPLLSIPEQIAFSEIITPVLETIMNVRFERQMAEKYREAFLEDLLLNNVKTDGEIRNRSRMYGWDFSQGGLAAVVDINNIKKYFIDGLDPDTNRMLENATEVIFRHAIREMGQSFPEARYLKQSDLIAFIISAPAEARGHLSAQLEKTFETLQKQLARVSPFTITLGVGQYYENIRDISKSYEEARLAINLGYSLQWFDQILFYRRLGLYRLLAPIANGAEATELCETYVQPLLDYDQQYRGELFDTLQVLLEEGWSLKAAAASLYIHYNSMKYRFGKISAVLGLNLNDHDNRSLVEVAMKLHLLRKQKGRRG